MNAEAFFWFSIAFVLLLAFFVIVLSLLQSPQKKEKLREERKPREEKKPSHTRTIKTKLTSFLHRAKKPRVKKEAPKKAKSKRPNKEQSYARAIKTKLTSFLHRAKKPRPKILSKEQRAEVKPTREPFSLRFVSGSDFARKTAMQLSQVIKDYIPKVALSISSYRFAAEHVFYMFVSLPVAAAAPFLAYFFHFVFLALLFLPLIFFVMPWIRLKSMVGDYKRATDAELPFFTIHAAISQSAGLNIFESLRSTIGRKIFRQIERAALLAKRYFRVLGMGPIAVVERIGMEHPHPGMRQLLLGYTSEFRSGGNVTAYLEAKADEHLRLTQYRYDRYSKNVGTIMEIVLTVLLIFPAVLLMALFLMPEGIMTIGLGFLALGIPVILAFCYSLIRTSQPKDYTEYSSNFLFAFGAAAIAFVAALPFSTWFAVSLAAGAGALAYGLPVVFQRREIFAHERSLPQFLRDVTEYQKLNYPVAKAIIRLRKNPAYAPAFRRLLGDVMKKLAMGYRLAEINVPSRSWLTRMTFFQLGQIVETGGISPKVTELLTGFITRVKEARDETRRSVGMHRVIALMVPFILAAITGMMMGTLEAVSYQQMPEVVGVGLPGLFAPPPVFSALSVAMILLSSIGVTFITSYATDFTPKNTIWVALSAFLAAASIALIPLLAELVTAAIF